jgi:hypothetical protein
LTPQAEYTILNGASNAISVTELVVVPSRSAAELLGLPRTVKFNGSNVSELESDGTGTGTITSESESSVHTYPPTPRSRLTAAYQALALEIPAPPKLHSMALDALRKAANVSSQDFESLMVSMQIIHNIYSFYSHQEYSAERVIASNLEYTKNQGLGVQDPELLGRCISEVSCSPTAGASY